MFEVIIPASNEKVFSDDWCICDSELSIWLRTYIGNGAFGRYVIPGDLDWDYYSERSKYGHFLFKRKDQAVLFKLVWG